MTEDFNKTYKLTSQFDPFHKGLAWRIILANNFTTEEFKTDPEGCRQFPTAGRDFPSFLRSEAATKMVVPPERAEIRLQSLVYTGEAIEVI